MPRKHEPPSNQMALEGLGFEGEELMEEVRKWPITYGCIHGNGMWEFMVDLAREQAKTGRISAKYIVEVARAKYRVKISNNKTPAIARVMIENYPEFEGKFDIKSSRCDSWTRAKL